METTRVISSLYQHVINEMNESPDCKENKCVVTVNSFEILSSPGLFRMIANHADPTKNEVPEADWSLVSLEDGGVTKWLNDIHGTTVTVPSLEEVVEEFEYDDDDEGAFDFDDDDEFFPDEEF